MTQRDAAHFEDTPSAGIDCVEIPILHCRPGVVILRKEA
jgi:hypothetical protein